MVATPGLDAYGAIPVAHLDGYDFVGRYVSEQPGKCIVAAEVTAYHKAGKSFILAYEDQPDDALGGANAGAAKATIARPVLKAIGWPTNLPVHFACDMPGYREDLVAFVACAKTFAEGIARPPGIYGDVDTCTYAYQQGIRYLWQFGEGTAPGMTVHQGYPPVNLDGQPCDPDEAFVADYGQWAPPPPPVPPLRPPPSGRPTEDQLVARQFVVLEDSFTPGVVSKQAEIARRNGWPVFYFAGEHGFVAVPEAHPIPTGIWLYAFRSYHKKRSNNA
jgi:hypothetical protein